MTTTTLSSAISGMLAAQIGLQTTEHNIANQSTAGFNRQRIIQASNTAMLTGAGFIGQGTHVSTVERMYSSFLSNQVNVAQTTSSELDSYYAQITQIDNMLADSSAGLSPALQDFFTGVQQVAANPSLLPARQAMLSSAQALVARYQGLESRLQEMYDGVNTQLQTQVSTINSYSSQIGALNQQIVVAQSSINQPANDLLDQRDQLVSELNKLVKVTTTTNSDGSFNVFFGTGQQLVVGTQSMTLKAVPSSADPSRFTVGLSTGGATQELPESLLAGGSLGGLLKFRSESLDKTANDLGRNAASLALTFNARNELGQDLLGQMPSADFFTLSDPKVNASSRNTGTAVLSAAFADPSHDGNFYTNLTGSDYQLSFDGSNYTMLRLSDNKSWSNGALGALSTQMAASEGFSFSPASGAIAAGDSFVIRPVSEAARNLAVDAAVAADVRLIAAAMPFSTAAGKTNTGTGKISAGETMPGFVSAAIPLTLTYDSATTSLTGFPAGASVSVTVGGSTTTYTVPASTAIPYTPGTTATIAYAGMSFDISGNPNNSDTFSLSKNTSGVSDSRNALLLGKLQTQSTMSGKTATFQSAYAQLVSDVGNKTRQISVTGEAQQALLKQNQAAREALSGVNLDEEAANLIKYQQAYQASAKALQIGTSLFDTLLGIMN